MGETIYSDNLVWNPFTPIPMRNPFIPTAS